jgi:hypothetical protein
LLRRNRGNIVPYCRALMMAVPGNHMISLVPELSRFIRDMHLYMLAKKNNQEVRSSMEQFIVDVISSFIIWSCFMAYRCKSLDSRVQRFKD